MQIGKELEAMMKSAEALKSASSDLKESSKQITEQAKMFGETSSEMKKVVKGWGSTIKSMLGPFGNFGEALGKDLKKMFTKDEKSGAAAKEAANEARRSAVKHETLMGAIAAHTKTTARNTKDMLKNLGKKAMELGLKGLGLTVAVIAAPVIMIVSFFKSLSAELAFLKRLVGPRMARMFAPIKNLIAFFGRIGRAIRNIIPGGARAGRLIGRTIGRVKGGLRLVMGFIRSIGASIRGLITPVIRMARTSTAFMRGFAPIARFAAGMGRILGRLFLPITIIMSVFDFVRGFMRGWKEDGIIGAIREGVAEVFGTLVGWPLNMLKSGVAWILEKFGFTELSTSLGELDFKQIVMDLVRMPYNALLAIIDWAFELFDDPAAAMAKLWTGMSNFAQIAIDAMKAVWTWITDKLSFVSEGIAGAWTTVTAKAKEIWDKVHTWFTGLFTWASEGIAGTWTGLVGFIKEKFDGVISFLTDLFTWPDSPIGFATKLIDIILLPYNLIINFLRDIFGWGEDEEGKTEAFSLGTFIVEKILAVVTWVKEKFAFAADAVIEGWTGLKTFIADGAIAVKDWIVDKFTFGVDAVIEGWTGLSTFIKDAAIAVKDWIVGKFSFASDAVIAGWGGLLSFVTSAVGNIKNFFWHEDGKSGILQFENPLADFSPMDWVTNVLTKIKNFFWHPDGKSGVLQFDLLGSLPDFDIGGMFEGIGDMFSIDSILGGIGRKIQAVDPWPGPDLVQDALLKVFDPTKGVKAAMGGMVKADQWAMVGEEGPELVKFSNAAQVIPNHALGPMAAGQGTTVINNNNVAPVTTNTSTAVKVATAIGISDPFTNVQVAY